MNFQGPFLECLALIFDPWLSLALCGDFWHSVAHPGTLLLSPGSLWHSHPILGTLWHSFGTLWHFLHHPLPKTSGKTWFKNLRKISGWNFSGIWHLASGILALSGSLTIWQSGNLGHFRTLSGSLWLASNSPTLSGLAWHSLALSSTSSNNLSKTSGKTLLKT